VPGVSQTSCMLEALDGLILLAEQTGQEHYWQAVLDSLQWARLRMFLPQEGLFLDEYDPATSDTCVAPAALQRGIRKPSAGTAGCSG